MSREYNHTLRVMHVFALCFCVVNVESLHSKDLICYKSHALGKHSLPPKCFQKLPANGNHSVKIPKSCKVALDENSFVSAINNAVKAPPPQFTDVLVMTSTYFFDKRMHTDLSLWHRQFQALNAQLKNKQQNHHYHFAIAYTGMLDEPPTPLSSWQGRRLNTQEKCGTHDDCVAPPPPGVDIRVIKKTDFPDNKYFKNNSLWWHGHYSLPVAMKNIFESEKKTFSHVWFVDPDIAYLGNFAQFIHHHMVTRGETLLGTVAIATSLRRSYQMYTRPSRVDMNRDWKNWAFCKAFKKEDKRGLVPTLLRLSASMLNTLPLHYDKACYLEVFIPTACNVYVPNCTIGTIADEFYGWVTWKAPMFNPKKDQSSAKLLKALSMDWRFNQSTLWHPVKLHDDWRSLEPRPELIKRDLSFLRDSTLWNKTDVWSRHSVEFGSKWTAGYKMHDCKRHK